MEQGLKFKAMYARLGFSVDDTAKFLQVTPRTVHLWISGRVRIPYAAYKLMRLQLHYELPGKAWQGWSLSAGRLYTPEGFELAPDEVSWWSLLVRQARCFRSLYQQQATQRAPAGSHAGARDACAPGWPRLVAGQPESGYRQSCPESPASKSSVRPLGPLASPSAVTLGETPAVSARMGPFWGHSGNIPKSWHSTSDFPQHSTPSQGTTAIASESASIPLSASPLMPIYDSRTARLSFKDRSPLPRYSFLVPRSPLLPPLPSPSTSRASSSSPPRPSDPRTLSPSCRRTPRRPTAPVLRSGTSAIQRVDPDSPDTGKGDPKALP